MDFRTAISLVLPITTMMRVLTMLKAATSTTRAMMTERAVFSRRRAEKIFLFMLIQSLARYPLPRRPSIRFATMSALEIS